MLSGDGGSSDPVTTCKGFIRWIGGGFSPPGRGGGGGGGGSAPLITGPVFRFGASGISMVLCTSSTVFHFLSLPRLGAPEIV